MTHARAGRITVEVHIAVHCAGCTATCACDVAVAFKLGAVPNDTVQDAMASFTAELNGSGWRPAAETFDLLCPACAAICAVADLNDPRLLRRKR